LPKDITAKAYKLNQAYGAKTPIIDAVHSILYEGDAPKKNR
jgi:glycerol-3-phosphate dehydrogenase (NAD(P)+)